MNDGSKTGKTGKPGTSKKKYREIKLLGEMTEDEREFLKRVELMRAMPDDIAGALALARTKPQWCSDIRWRMELKRRVKVRNGGW